MLSKSVPYLPGHVFSDPMKTRFSKDQLLIYKQNTCIEKPRNLEPMDKYTLESLRGIGLGKSVTIPLSTEPSKVNETVPTTTHSLRYSEGFDSVPRVM